MERIEGTVRALDHEQRVVGGERPGRAPAAVHVYRFEIDGRALELRHGAPLPLGDGDAVVAVAGGRRPPRRVYAWHNRTRGATLVEPAGPAAAMRGWLPAIPAVALLASAAWLASGAPGVGAIAGAALAAFAGIGLAGLALRGFVEYGRYRRAARLLQAASG